MRPHTKDYLEVITTVAHDIAHLIRSQNGEIKNIYNNWTIATTAAHLVLSQRMSKQVMQGEKNPYKNAKPETVAETNEHLLSTFSERNPAKLATMLVMDTENILKVCMTQDENTVYKTHFGSMDLQTFLSYNLCHLLIHESQISRSLKKPYLVTEQSAELTIPFIKKAMLVTYSKDTDKRFIATFRIQLKNMKPFFINCHGEEITINDEFAGVIDCTIATDVKTFFLVSTNLENQWNLLFKGKISVWGRRPWLALKLTNLFKNP